MLGLCDIDARQLGCLHKQRFHGDLDAGEDGAAQVCAVFVNAVKGDGRADIYDDKRRAILFNRRHSIDQAVHADLTRIGIVVDDPGLDIPPHDHRAQGKILADCVDQRIHHRRHDRGNDHGLGLLWVISAEVIILQNRHANLVRGRGGVGRNTERAPQFAPLIQAKHHVGVAHVNG